MLVLIFDNLLYNHSNYLFNSNICRCALFVIKESSLEEKLIMILFIINGVKFCVLMEVGIPK
jgi:hypothetical protein